MQNFRGSIIFSWKCNLFHLPGFLENLINHTLPENHKEVQVKMSAFGLDASVIGAIATVVEAILSKPTLSEGVVL